MVFRLARDEKLAEARVVRDDEAQIVATVNDLRARHTYVFTTGGIGPTHDDITADSVAKAFGVELYEHPDILAMMQARWQGELNAARRRMARVPVGGDLVKNPVQGPPGFTIGNVFVLAGVPMIMRGMLEDVGPRMRPGKVVIARTVRVEGTGEGAIAAPLETLAKAHPTLSLGSYPFFGDGIYGSNLVIRGRDLAEVEATVDELFQEVWMNVIQAAPRYRPEAQFRTWLFTIAHNKLMDYFRANVKAEARLYEVKDGEESVDIEFPGARTEEPEVQTDSNRARSAILKALDGLPAPQREATGHDGIR